MLERRVCLQPSSFLRKGDYPLYPQHKRVRKRLDRSGFFQRDVLENQRRVPNHKHREFGILPRLVSRAAKHLV